MRSEWPGITQKENLPQGSLEEFVKNSPLLTKAYDLAKKAHEGQFRAEGTPYFTHCIEVARIFYEEWEITDSEKIAVGLLHDTVEDTNVVQEELATKFGSKVAFWVDGVSQFRSEKEKENGKSKAQRDRENVRKVFNKNQIDPFVGAAKLADRLHNMRTLGFMPLEKQVAKARETEGYAKLAESLGMWEVMRELEDLSLKYVDPQDYEKYSRIRNEDPRTDEQFVEWLKSTLSAIANNASINARIETRLISLPKLRNKKGRYLTEKINDLIGFRVVVDGNNDPESRNKVYKMLGAIRQHFVGIEDLGRFDDFYSSPKDNNYSAIQSTLDFPQGSTEVAITCEEKEDFNNWGVISLIRKGETELSEHALKLIFTITGEVKPFPPEATGLDFAYSISPNLGATARYILINGEKHPISTILPNGAEVQVIPGESRIAPPKEFRYFCLPKTRRMIDEQLSDEEKWKYEVKGQGAVYNIVSKRGLIDLADLLKMDQFKATLENLLYILGCKGSIKDLYYKVGSGVMDLNDLEKNLDACGITKTGLGISSILIEGVDGPGISTLVTSEVGKLGGNIGPMENRPHKNKENITFTLRMVVENLSNKNESKLRKTFHEDPRITNVVIV